MQVKLALIQHLPAIIEKSVEPRDRVSARSTRSARSVRTAIESIIGGDPVATCVRELMSERGSWVGSVADLLRLQPRTRQPDK